MTFRKHTKHSAAVLLLVLLFYVTFSIPKVFADNGTITAQDGKLYFHGQQYAFTGVNAYELATDHAVNWGCGGMLSDGDLDSFFGSLRPNSLVRFWAFQDLAINKQTTQRDWTAIDRVFASAQNHSQRLLVSIGNHWNACDGGGQKNDAWYQGGYMQPFSPDGYPYRVSYWNYLQELVSRYKSSSALGMWELVNEPEMTCGGHVQELKTFFDTVGGELKSIDPNHLLELGVTGGNQCSVEGTDYSVLLGSSAIDVADYHDYNAETQPMPGTNDPNGLPMRIQQAKAANKPIIIGESGVHGSDTVSGCTNLETRVDYFKAKMDAQFSAGISGYLVWNWQLSNGGCAYDITPSDPLMTLLSTYNVSPFMPATTVPAPTNTATGNNSGTAPKTSSQPVNAAPNQPPVAPYAQNTSKGTQVSSIQGKPPVQVSAVRLKPPSERVYEVLAFCTCGTVITIAGTTLALKYRSVLGLSERLSRITSSFFRFAGKHHTV